MEIPRLCLAINGKFPGEGYTDGRYQAPPLPLEANLGRMPLCSVGDEHIGQSGAINFYIAAENGLLGSNNLEAAQILGVCEHVKEMLVEWRKVCAYGAEPTAEILDKWFGTGAEDATGAAERAGYGTRFMKWWSGRIEASLHANGFAVGNKLSLADVMIYNTFAEVLLKEETAEDSPDWKRFPFGSQERTNAVLAACPRLNASVEAVKANAGAQRHWASRGKQGF